MGIATKITTKFSKITFIITFINIKINFTKITTKYY